MTLSAPKVQQQFVLEQVTTQTGLLSKSLSLFAHNQQNPTFKRSDMQSPSRHVTARKPPLFALRFTQRQKLFALPRMFSPGGQAIRGSCISETLKFFSH